MQHTNSHHPLVGQENLCVHHQERTTPDQRIWWGETPCSNVRCCVCDNHVEWGGVFKDSGFESRLDLYTSPRSLRKEAHRPHIRGLELADEHTGNEAKEVGLLIGQDFYYDIIKGEPVKCKSAPTIVSLIFNLTYNNVFQSQSNCSSGFESIRP